MKKVIWMLPCILLVMLAGLAVFSYVVHRRQASVPQTPVTQTWDAGFTSEEEEESVSEVVEEPSVQLDTSRLLTGKHHAQIDIRNYGTIVVELDADIAPISVTNFVTLVQDGFYNGLTFHRIISGFMIQGGDPNGNGTGGSATNIKGEFASNGVENPISHERGVISMARSRDYNSASSQFFIMHGNAAYLDGDYAAFGHVTSGMEVVDKICDMAQPLDNNGTIAAAQQPVIEKIIIKD